MNLPSRSFIHTSLPLLSLVIGCGSPESIHSSRSVDSAGVTIVTNKEPSWKPADRWTVESSATMSAGRDGTQGAHTLYRVAGALRLASGTIVAADDGNKQLSFYSSQGSYLYSTGREGSGPGEFRSITWIGRYGEGRIAAFDHRSQRLSIFDTTGSFTRSMTLQSDNSIPSFANLEGIAANSSLVVSTLAPPAGRNQGLVRLTQRLFNYGPSAIPAAEMGTFPGPEIYVSGGGGGGGFEQAIFPHFTTYRVAGNSIYVGSNDIYEIRVLDLTGTLHTIVSREHEPVPVTQRHAELRVDRSHRQSQAPLPGFFPAYRSFDLDAEGNIWVEEYPIPGLLEQWRSVFDPTGNYLGQIAIPAGLQILDIGSDYVLGIVRDDLDIEQIRLHRINKPRA